MLRYLHILLVLFLLIPSAVGYTLSQEAGPVIFIDLEWEVTEKNISDAVVLLCDASSCSEGPIDDAALTTCSAVQCSSLTRGFSEYRKLILNFEDGSNITSNTFKSQHPEPTLLGKYHRIGQQMISEYNAVITPDSVRVTTEPFYEDGSSNIWVIAFLITVSVEVLMTFLLFYNVDFRGRLIRYVLYANVVAFPILWAVLPNILPVFKYDAFAAYSISVLIEAGIVWNGLRDHISFYNTNRLMAYFTALSCLTYVVTTIFLGVLLLNV